MKYDFAPLVEMLTDSFSPIDLAATLDAIGHDHATILIEHQQQPREAMVLVHQLEVLRTLRNIFLKLSGTCGDFVQNVQ